MPPLVDSATQDSAFVRFLFRGDFLASTESVHDWRERERFDSKFLSVGGFFVWNLLRSDGSTCEIVRIIVLFDPRLWDYRVLRLGASGRGSASLYCFLAISCERVVWSQCG